MGGQTAPPLVLAGHFRNRRRKDRNGFCVQSSNVDAAVAHHIDAMLFTQQVDLCFGQAKAAEHAAMAGHEVKSI